MRPEEGVGPWGTTSSRSGEPPQPRTHPVVAGAEPHPLARATGPCAAPSSRLAMIFGSLVAYCSRSNGCVRQVHARLLPEQRGRSSRVMMPFACAAKKMRFREVKGRVCVVGGLTTAWSLLHGPSSVVGYRFYRVCGTFQRGPLYHHRVYVRGLALILGSLRTAPTTWGTPHN